MKVTLAVDYKATLKLEIASYEEAVFLKNFFGNLSTTDAERIAEMKQPSSDIISKIYIALESVPTRNERD